MNQPVDDGAGGAASEARRAARWLAQWNLIALGGAFAWFAYVDAPITDGAMWLIAAAVTAGLLSLIAALYSGEWLQRPAGGRARRAALLLFAIAAALLLIAATATLNLKGGGSDDVETATRLPLRA